MLCIIMVRRKYDGNIEKGAIDSVQGSPEVLMVQKMLKEINLPDSEV